MRAFHLPCNISVTGTDSMVVGLNLAVLRFNCSLPTSVLIIGVIILYLRSGFLYFVALVLSSDVNVSPFKYLTAFSDSSLAFSNESRLYFQHFKTLSACLDNTPAAYCEPEGESLLYASLAIKRFSSLYYQLNLFVQCDNAILFFFFHIWQDLAKPLDYHSVEHRNDGHRL